MCVQYIAENTITKIKPHKILMSIKVNELNSLIKRKDIAKLNHKAKLNSMLNARHISERFKIKGWKTKW